MATSYSTACVLFVLLILFSSRTSSSSSSSSDSLRTINDQSTSPIKNTQRFRKYDIAVLDRFRKILDNEIVFLSSQIVSLHTLKRSLNQAVDTKFSIRSATGINKSTHRQILVLVGQMVRHMNYLILHITRLMRLRYEMKRFILSQKKNALDWNDDIIKEYPLKLYLDEYFNTTSNRLQDTKSEISHHYSKFAFFVTHTIKAEHMDGSCDENSGPLHWAMGAVNLTFSFDIRRILGGYVDES